MKVLFEFDDLHPQDPENCLPFVQEVLLDNPQLKLNFFLIPKLRGQPIYNDPEWCATLRNLIEQDRIQVGIHGLTHEPREMLIGDHEARLEEAIKIMEQAGLPWAPVFRAPRWEISDEAIPALLAYGFKAWFAHPSDERHAPIPIYKYTWNLKDDPGELREFVIAHGHTHNVCGNGIRQVMHRVLTFADRSCLFTEIL